MMGMGGMLLMWLFWIALLVLLVWGVYRLVKSSRSGSSSRRRAAEDETPMDVLERRYAAGEISTDEYEERKRKLREQ